MGPYYQKRRRLFFPIELKQRSCESQKKKLEIGCTWAKDPREDLRFNGVDQQHDDETLKKCEMTSDLNVF